MSFRGFLALGPIWVVFCAVLGGWEGALIGGAFWLLVLLCRVSLNWGGRNTTYPGPDGETWRYGL